ncbi:MAG: hypothetical protein M0P73_04270 [Syntrophobacterales bacterium]|jgi:non-homologous end joining protein Ku|nr:hypothetical protein [Syntrophobacterales bacterium]
MRAIWKGCLRCSLATIPIKMFSATPGRPRQFQLHPKNCGSRLIQGNLGSAHGRTLDPA